jgi:hypothetical protein
LSIENFLHNSLNNPDSNCLPWSIGPSPLSHKGNKYVLIVSDYFTKWAEGYPIPDMETTTIVDNFVKEASVCIF